MEPIPYLYKESYVGNDTLLEFRLTSQGKQRDVSTGYTFVLNYEVDVLGTIMTPIACSSGETNALWTSGIVTVRLPESATADPVRYNVCLTSALAGKKRTEATGVVLVLHQPGVADA